MITTKLILKFISTLTLFIGLNLNLTSCSKKDPARASEVTEGSSEQLEPDEKPDAQITEFNVEVTRGGEAVATYSTVSSKSIGEGKAEESGPDFSFKIIPKIVIGSIEDFNVETTFSSLFDKDLVLSKNAGTEFARSMKPGIYIINTRFTLIDKPEAFPISLKYTLIVTCEDTSYELDYDVSQVEIRPIGEKFFQHELNMPGECQVMGKYRYRVPASAINKAGKYAYYVDSTGDGLLNHGPYLIGSWSDELYSPYASAKDQAIQIIDACGVTKQKMVTGRPETFEATVKEDMNYLTSPPPISSLTWPIGVEARPIDCNGGNVQLFEPEDFLQMRTEKVDTNEDFQAVQRSGILSYIKRDMILMEGKILGSTINFTTDWAPKGLRNIVGNRLGRYKASLQFSNLRTLVNENGARYYDPSNLQLRNITLEYPGHGDIAKAYTIKGSNCSVNAKMPIINETFSACAPGQIGDGVHTVTQYIHLDFTCNGVTNGRIGTTDEKTINITGAELLYRFIRAPISTGICRNPAPTPRPVTPRPPGPITPGPVNPKPDPIPAPKPAPKPDPKID